MMTDKERIEKIIQAKKLSNIEFCNQTAMAASTLSHILSERTKPTLAVLRNIVEAFPDLNPMWVLLGQGEMFSKDTPVATSEEHDAAPASQDDIDDVFSALKNGLGGSSASPGQASSSSPSPSTLPSVQSKPSVDVEEVVALTMARLQKPQRKVTEVRIFFDDGTYETFSARS